MSGMQALTLVRFLDGGRAELQEQTLSTVLESQFARDRPVAVISVSGAYRRGKSFFINFLIRYLRAKGTSTWLESGGSIQGFNWSFGSDRVTTGILIWPEVFVINNVAVVLVDTQGTFDRETNMKENTAIVAISSLISSVQIFNYHERLESQDLMNLEFFLEYGKLLHTQNGSTGNVRYFQDLLFLIRDWAYADEYKYGFDGGNCYLKNFIQPSNGIVNASLVSTREMLDTCFETVRCFLMPHPGDEVASGRTFTGQIGDMEPEFLSSMKVLVESLLSPQQLKKKTIAGQVVTGRQLMQHVRAYVATFNSGELPEPKTMFNILADEVARTLVKTSRDEYLRLMNEGADVAVEDAQIRSLHDTSREAALSHFDNGQKIGSLSHVQTFRNMLLEQIDEECKRFMERAFHKREFLELKLAFDQQKRVNEQLQDQLMTLQYDMHEKETQIKAQAERINELTNQMQETKAMAQEQDKRMAFVKDSMQKLMQDNECQAKRNLELQKSIEENSRKMEAMRTEVQKVKKPEGGFLGRLGGLVEGISKVADLVIKTFGIVGKIKSAFTSSKNNCC